MPALLNPLLKSNLPALHASLPTQPILQQSDQTAPGDRDLFTDLQDKVKRLNAEWQKDISKTNENRALRYVTADVADMRRAQLLKEDEIYIPIRIVNDNITKEAAQYISYLTTSRNAAIFKPQAELPPEFNPAIIQERFTDYVRYPAWELAFFRVLDGAQLHGWDSVEIEYDKNKPGKFAITHIAHENLWFAKDIENIQSAPILVRNVYLSKSELQQFLNVDPEQVEKVFENTEQTQQKSALKCIQKVFYKRDNVVYVCWLDHKTSTDFIRKPQPLFLGKMQAPKPVNPAIIALSAMSNGQQPQQPQPTPIYEEQYPIEPLAYIISENGKLAETKGRAFLDEYVQEACSSLISSIVNSWHRASKVFAAPSQPTGAAEPELTDTKLVAGGVYNMPIEFFHMPYPDISGLELIQGLVTQNKQETSQVNFAVTNREDSRKTAKEISAVQSEAALLSGVQVTLFSIFLRNVYTRCWSIAQSQLEQKILVDPLLDDMYIKMPYELASAGDTEVIKREELINKMQQSWPVYQATPAASAYLEDLTALLFPQNAKKYIDAIRAGDVKAQTIASMGKILLTLLEEHPELFSPEDQKNLTVLLTSGMQAIAPPGSPGKDIPPDKIVEQAQSGASAA